MRKKILLFALTVVVVTFFVFLFTRMGRSQPLLLQGEVESVRLDITTRVHGRVELLQVDVGDDVKKGQVLVKLSSPQLMAQRLAAEADLAVSVAERARIYATREETIATKKAELSRAIADVQLAKQQYDRYAELAGKGTVSRQSFDEISNRYQVAKNIKESADSSYRLVVNGSSPEEKALAETKVEQSKARLRQIETDINELTIVAPIQGQTILRVAELGQLVNAGNPLLSLMDISDPWVVFHVREDRLSGLEVGDRFTVMVPALSNKRIELHITALNALGQYANWRATKATGDFDLKTFEIRAKPLEPVAGLRPGMSVVTEWDNFVKSAP